MDNSKYIKSLFFITLLFIVNTTAFSLVIEDFKSGKATGWIPSGAALTDTFIVGDPKFQMNLADTQPEDDHTPGNGINTHYITTNGSVGVNDVNGGSSITTSSIYPVTANSDLSIWYFYGQLNTDDDPNDFFKIKYSLASGTVFNNLTNIGDVQTPAIWTEVTTPIPAGSNIVIKVTISDGLAAGDIIEAGINDLNILPVNLTIDNVTVDKSAETGIFTVTHQGTINIAANLNSGILISGGTTSTTIQNNHIFQNGTDCGSNITINSGSGISIEQNLIEEAGAFGIDDQIGNIVPITNRCITCRMKNELI